VTVRVRRGLPSLRDGRVVREVQRSFARAAEQGTFRVVHFSLQRDHVHLLVEAASPAALARGMMSIGARIARAVHRAFGICGRVLAERYHHRVLRTPREVRNVLVYVLHNLRKHAPRTAHAIDPASSGRWFEGWTTRTVPHVGPKPVAAARSWLLRVGWRRHGLIDPAEAPA
jgi:REP element-mobilizing transposase RayT